MLKLKAQRNIFGQLLMLSQENNLDLQKVMEFPLGPVPWSLATADGMPIKTDKSALMTKLEDKTAYIQPKKERDHVHVIDGNALFHSLTQIPDTIGEVAEHIFNCLPKVKRVHFVTDNYDDVSIKSTERLRRGESQEVSLAGPSMKTPKDWKEFLRNEENKKQLIRFILTEWEKDQYSQKLYNREIYFGCDNMCFLLSNSDGQSTDSMPVNCLFNRQEEADTLLILHSLNADSEENEDMDIIVRSPDSDVFFLLVSYSKQFKHPLYFDTGNSNKRRMIHIQKLCGIIPKESSDAILAYHAFTGCDSTSAFLQKGKVRPLKHLSKNPDFVVAFKELGKHELVPDNVFNQIEKFVCQMYGGKPHEKSVDKMRYDRVRQKYRPKGTSPLSCLEGLDVSLLPPCQQALRKHTLRANYQTMIWRHAHISHPDIPHPSGHGWTMNSDDILFIDWCTDPVPQQLVDILHTRTEEDAGDRTHLREEESDLESSDDDGDDNSDDDYDDDGDDEADDDDDDDGDDYF